MPAGNRITRALVFGVAALYLVFGVTRGVYSGWREREASFDDVIRRNAAQALERGRRTFRDDTFGDEDFWGGALRLHEAIAGAANGGQGSGLSPRVALELGLKVDLDALPESVVQQLRRGRVNLDDPAVTLALLKIDAVIGVKGFFRGDRLQSVGIQCALCHSTVDNALAPGIGRRLDGWANRDLNVGAIVALSPRPPAVRGPARRADDATVRMVLNELGAGQVRRGAVAGRQGVPARRQVRRHADPAGVRSGGRQPPHLDRLGLGHVLERASSRTSRCTARARSSIRG